MQYSFKLHLNNENDTQKLATFLGQHIAQGVIYLIGDLGAGKTTLTRYWLQNLGHQGAVKSPTYTIVNEYKKDGKCLFHFDVYRIEDDDDLYSMGFYDYLKKGICVCEWSENIPWAIPRDAYRITIERIEESIEHRRITIEKE